MSSARCFAAASSSSLAASAAACTAMSVSLMVLILLGAEALGSDCALTVEAAARECLDRIALLECCDDGAVRGLLVADDCGQDLRAFDGGPSRRAPVQHRSRHHDDVDGPRPAAAQCDQQAVEAGP